MPEEKILVKELEGLERELVEMSRSKAETAEVGGDMWAHNPAFDAIELAQRALMRRIAEVRNRLSRAVIVEDAPEEDGSATIGSVVEIEFEDGERTTVRIGDYTEADPSKGVISYQSPLGTPSSAQSPGTSANIASVTERLSSRSRRLGGGKAQKKLKRLPPLSYFAKDRWCIFAKGIAFVVFSQLCSHTFGGPAYRECRVFSFS